MSKFVIQPHFRLQEWVAEEKGYFRDEGLDYIFQEEVLKTDGKIHDQGVKAGAFQSFILEALQQALDVGIGALEGLDAETSRHLGEVARELRAELPDVAQLLPVVLEEAGVHLGTLTSFRHGDGPALEVDLGAQEQPSSRGRRSPAP